MCAISTFKPTGRHNHSAFARSTEVTPLNRSTILRIASRLFNA